MSDADTRDRVEKPDDDVPPVDQIEGGTFVPHDQTPIGETPEPAVPQEPGEPEEPLEPEEKPRLDQAQLKAIVEALVFASPEPLTPKMLFKLLADEPKEDVTAAVAALKTDYTERGGLHLAEVAGGYQITTRPEFHDWVRRLFHERSTQKLSVASLRDAGGDLGQTADYRRGDRRDPRREHQRRALDAARAASDQDRGTKERDRPSLPIRHHA